MFKCESIKSFFMMRSSDRFLSATQVHRCLTW